MATRTRSRSRSESSTESIPTGARAGAQRPRRQDTAQRAFATTGWSPANNVAVAGPERARALVRALRSGDEVAYGELVDRYHGPMLRLARYHVRDRAVAEEVVQETWLGVIRGIDRFEGRSSLRTWIYRILTNTAKKRAVREQRTVPFSALGAVSENDEGAIDSERFELDGTLWTGRWVASSPWQSVPEERLLESEAQAVIDQAISMLPDIQRQVITLRDVEGWSPEEVCDLLGLSDGNHRVLLHRARTKVRAEFDSYRTPMAA